MVGILIFWVDFNGSSIVFKCTLIIAIFFKDSSQPEVYIGVVGVNRQNFAQYLQCFFHLTDLLKCVVQIEISNFKMGVNLDSFAEVLK